MSFSHYLELGATGQHDHPLVVRLQVLDRSGQRTAEDLLDPGRADDGQVLRPLPGRRGIVGTEEASTDRPRICQARASPYADRYRDRTSRPGGWTTEPITEEPRLNWMYWIAIGVAIITVIGGWLHSRYDSVGEGEQSSAS